MPSPGFQTALAENPDCADVLALLAAVPERVFRSVEPGVRAAVAARAGRLALLRRGGAVLAAAALLAAAVLLAPSSLRGTAPSPALASASSPAASDLLSLQRPDGSWRSARGGEASAPAATALAMLELAGSGDPAAAEAVARGAAWLRARQNPDGSFGSAPVDTAAGAWNLALGATALMRLYEAGGREDLFTPIDGAVGAVRERLARPSAADVPLAAALALADSLEWPDAAAGDLRRAMRRLDVAGDTFAARRAALARLAGRI